MRGPVLLIIFCCCLNQTTAQTNWPEFRGPLGNGHTTSTNLPLTWDAAGKNILWKTEIHDKGWSSPVIWEEQIWLTTATRDGKKMYAICVDKKSGKLIHDRLVFEVANPQPISIENSYATPTSVIEQGRVYLHYGTYGTACLDTKTGEKIWERRDLNCDHENGAGPASSPMLLDDLFIVNVDGRDNQYVIALNKKTGKTAWKTDRSADFDKVPVNQRKAYSMPTLFSFDGSKQLVSNGGKAIYSYDPKSGKELWRIRHHGFSQAPRPVFGHGLVFATVDRDNPELWAMRPGGNGDVTETHVVWKEKKAMPRRCSPLLVDGLLYLVSRNGVISCMVPKTGELVWRERVPGSYSASPIYASNRIYLFNDDGLTLVIRPGRKLDIISKNALEKDALRASPAISDNALFIRTENFLYRIETKAQP